MIDHMTVLLTPGTRTVPREMLLRLLLFALVTAHVCQADLGSGLCIMLRNETTRMVTVRTIGPPHISTWGEDTEVGLSSSSVSLAQCSVDVQIVAYSAMDTKRHIFVGRYKN